MTGPRGTVDARAPSDGVVQPAVLITDGEQRSTLAAVRSVGRAGYRVHVSTSSRRSLAGASRWTSAVLRAPDPLLERDAFAAAVAGYAAAHRIRVILPMTDASMLALLPVREALGGATIPFGSLGAFQRLADKAALRSAAQTCGIAFPEQVELSWECRDAFTTDGLRWPVVVKPARSVSEFGAERSKVGVRHAATPEAVRAAVRTYPRGAYPLLLQERIVGPGVGVFCLVWGDRLVASSAHQRLREKPPSGGVSVCAETIAVPRTLIDQSLALLQHLGWTGVAMVEYKIDEATNTPFLMEINGRFWGSLQLAIDAGVDFPALLVDLAMGRSAGQGAGSQPGVRNRWWWGDVDHLVARLRRSPRALSLPPDAPSRTEAFRAFLRPYGPRERDAVFRRDDPKPFLLETLQWLRLA